MSAIPTDSGDFQDPAFWKEFYKDSKDAFEWYGDFKTFSRVLSKYLKSTDKILQIGCGSSELASQLYDSGYRIIDSIDTDEGVIQKQAAMNNLSRPELQFSCCSAAKIDAPDGKYNVVLDKGTLDALMPSASDNMIEDVEKCLLKYAECLQLGSIHYPYSCSKSSAQCIHAFFSETYMELILSTEKKSIKYADSENLITAVNAEQEFSRFRHLCSNKLDDEVSIILHGNNEKPRYRIAVHDDPEITVLSSFAVFIVPVGRDHDWFFATEKGRSSLRKQCSKDRLAVVTLYRDQKYENMEQVKDELGPYVIQLTPASLRQTVERKSLVEFLSLGKIDVKETRATGDSDVSGPWAVEDVRIQSSLYRRLVFLSAQNLVQSEVKLIRNRRGREIVDLHTLTSEYHEAMLAALAFMLPPGEKLSHLTKSRLLVLGLGGGVLPSFLHLKFPSMSVVAVELDQKIAEIAAHCWKRSERWIELPITIICYGGSSKKMYAALRVLALNLVTRNDDIAEQVKARVLSIFPYYYSYCTEEDINQVLICPKVRKSLFEARRACENYRKEKGNCNLDLIKLKTGAIYGFFIKGNNSNNNGTTTTTNNNNNIGNTDESCNNSDNNNNNNNNSNNNDNN
ncbi:hypothetical protein DINM_020764 [Dirofilaria immitis]|nr:hypothetical protein [Dirofilaria immitis]